MKVFISWSGERSQALAQAVREWLPMVLYYTEPWLSHSDIEAGERWANVVAKELETSKKAGLYRCFLILNSKILRGP